MKRAGPLLVVLATTLLGACGASESAPPRGATATPPPPQGSATGSSEATAPPSCMPPGLEGARPVEMVRLPQGCSFTSSGSLVAPLLVRTPAELQAVLRCEGVAPPAIDLTTSQLQLASFTMSPAFGGSALVDDGTTVTFVQRDRPPCPGDPMPMPTPAGVLAYLLPQGATRAYRQLACSLPARPCP